MNPINASNMFNTMQQLANASRAGASAPSAEAAAVPGAGDTVKPNGGFNALLKSMVDNVNETQQTSAQTTNAYSRQEDGVDLADAMVAMQKARVHFEAMVQVRNRLVNSYQEIMRMPV
ncbi:MAG: flagellar hook-basal body complex protein FliE [Gammaproteobacteria bacterium]